MLRLDLHTHSTASDGVYSPSEVVQIAHTNAVQVLALSDHDSVEGFAEAATAGQALGIEVLPAVELSAEDALTDRHLLGYLFDPLHAPFLALLSELRAARVSRVAEMLGKLEALGVTVSLERVLALAKGGAAGRPHVARALIEAGAASSMTEAFARYLADDGPAYVPHFHLPPQRAIDAIHDAGGVAVLAHPGRYSDPLGRLDELLPLGIDGVEVYYPDHGPKLVDDLYYRAKRYGLIMTAGSDFHRREGDGSARIGRHKLPAGIDILTPLRARAERYK